MWENSLHPPEFGAWVDVGSGVCLLPRVSDDSRLSHDGVGCWRRRWVHIPPTRPLRVRVRTSPGLQFRRRKPWGKPGGYQVCHSWRGCWRCGAVSTKVDTTSIQQWRGGMEVNHLETIHVNPEPGQTEWEQRHLPLWTGSRGPAFSPMTFPRGSRDPAVGGAGQEDASQSLTGQEAEREMEEEAFWHSLLKHRWRLCCREKKLRSVIVWGLNFPNGQNAFFFK